MIKSFSASNYKNVEADNLKFGRVNILIGPNNVGKTNFIQAVSFLSQVLRKNAEPNGISCFLSHLGDLGWSRILKKGADSRVVSMKWDIEIDSQRLSYDFGFNVGTTSAEDFRIIKEELTESFTRGQYPEPYNYFTCHSPTIGQGVFSSATKKGQSNRRIQFDLDSHETIFKQFKDILIANKEIYDDSQVRKNVGELVKKIEDYFARFCCCSCAQLNLQKIRESVPLVSHDTFLKPDGSNFTSIYNLFKSRNLNWHIDYVDRMKQLIPDLKLADVVSEFEKLCFKLSFGNGTFDLSELSDGTIKALVLNLLINMPHEESKSLLAIDEPESNLHPAWQKVVGQWILNSNSFSQCFISTHSPDFLDSFTEDFKTGKVDVFVFSAEGKIRNISYDSIKEDLGNWELGDLYRTNDPALGGWPW